MQESDGEWQGNINELMEALDMSLTKRAYLSRLAMLKNDYACLFEPEIDGDCIFLERKSGIQASGNGK